MVKRLLCAALVAACLAPDLAAQDREKAKQIVETERQKFGAMDAAQVVQFLKGVAAALNTAGLEGGPFGVLQKTSGANCHGYSCDIICSGNGSAQRQWDVLSDSDPGGKQAPGWRGPLGTIAVRPCEAVSGEPTPPPAPPVPPDAVTKVDLQVAVAMLTARLEGLENRLKDVEARPVLSDEAVRQNLEAAINLALSQLVVQGQTNRSFGHSHRIDLRLTRIPQ